MGKKAFALRIDEEVMKALEKWAADEFRSVNGQIEWILHQSLAKAGRVPKKDKNNSDNHGNQDGIAS
ncbi:MAG: Arc family DNA binding domain-containing protein [Bacteroidetes bacterium GWF2_43_63]|nr:MAG: Arc family DNA binding domain-containing protein [Bacteroidetes bacterium GWE2_42_42]OFY53386.1 MAG: Arc family DNA binding domain-containing protein [Bacteroidetes bacterium GWF2_43_63]HBG69443.1 Arc family DNA binding domain-containing protein [Bacteroidales bacterium]HCB62062.1 Arc family DNA binding domain-containing protein [Bacteroidales bacterium]HCY23102.1 Arc family DNA binding domain-containing protein [Bacteroidales bacterium]